MSSDWSRILVSGCNSNSDVVRLRGCWCKLRSDICSVFRLVMDSAWNDSNRERPDLAGATRALVTELWDAILWTFCILDWWWDSGVL